MEDSENNETDNTNLFFYDHTSKSFDAGYDSAKHPLGSNSKVFTSLVEKSDVLECREKRSEFRLGSAFFGISEVDFLP